MSDWGIVSKPLLPNIQFNLKIKKIHILSYEISKSEIHTKVMIDLWIEIRNICLCPSNACICIHLLSRIIFRIFHRTICEHADIIRIWCGSKHGIAPAFKFPPKLERLVPKWSKYWNTWQVRRIWTKCAAKRGFYETELRHSGLTFLRWELSQHLH